MDAKVSLQEKTGKLLDIGWSFDGKMKLWEDLERTKSNDWNGVNTGFEAVKILILNENLKETQENFIAL